MGAGRTSLAIDPRRCRRKNCRAWATKDDGLCVGHSQKARKRSAEAQEWKRRDLNLPELTSIEACRTWLQIIAGALSEGRLKPVVAAELRRCVTAYAAVDPSSSLRDEIDELRERLAENGASKR